MGEFKAGASGDGSWAHPPEGEPNMGQMPPGPFQVTDMPAKPPVRPAQTEQDRHLLAGVAAPEQDEDW